MFLIVVVAEGFLSVAGCGAPERYSRTPQEAGIKSDGAAPEDDGSPRGVDATEGDLSMPRGSGGAPLPGVDGGSAGGSAGTGAGGEIAAGGATGTGGRAGTGGKPSTGGISGSGGVTGSGGATGTGGQSASGGVTGSGGRTNSGGVTGSTGGAGAGGSGAIDPKPDPDLVLWYAFDDGAGTVVRDGSTTARNAALARVGTGSSAFSTVHRVGTGAVDLSSSSASAGGYVNLPASLEELGATGPMSITCWVNIRTARSWQRVFDFGSNTTTYTHFTTSSTETTPPSPRFQITTAGNKQGQEINPTTPASLTIGEWHHVAVVLGAGATYTGTLYLDKVAVGQNAAMTLRPTDLGKTANNWIGRSQFSGSDPLFDGQIDDFRIYKRALTAAEIDALP